MSRPGRGLGRGLASLIPESALDNDALPAEREALRVVPIDEIKPNPEQPRVVFDKEALDELAASIRAHGILSPLVVRRADGRYVVIAGERRLRAAALAGLTDVPVIVREAHAPSHQLELALVENLQRSDLDSIEAARGFQRLIDDYGYTQDRVASAVGKDRSTVANLVRLLKLPGYILDAVRSGSISAGHARALLALVDRPSDLRTVLDTVTAGELNVRDTERMTQSLLAEPVPPPAEGPPPPVDGPPKKAPPERTYDHAVQLLERALHTTVSVKPSSGGGGRIVIDYSDREDFERLMTLVQGGRA